MSRLNVQRTQTERLRDVEHIVRRLRSLISSRVGHVLRGSGDPEGEIVAPVGTIFQRTDGGVGSTLYVKESGTGSTGWVAK